MRAVVLAALLLSSAAVVLVQPAVADNCTDYTLASGSASPSTLFSVTAINNILNEHNTARRNVHPFATAMPMLNWSQVLSDFAQEKVEELCSLTHSSNAQRSNATRFGWSYVGENLAYYTASSLDTLNGAYPVKLWNDEKADWTYPNCASGKVCGHYTQNIWAQTTHVGCGAKRCTDGKVQWRCVYGPGGNYNNQNPYTSTTDAATASHCTNTSTSPPSNGASGLLSVPTFVAGAVAILVSLLL